MVVAMVVAMVVELFHLGRGLLFLSFFVGVAGGFKIVAEPLILAVLLPMLSPL